MVTVYPKDDVVVAFAEHSVFANPLWYVVNSMLLVDVVICPLSSSVVVHSQVQLFLQEVLRVTMVSRPIR